MSRATKWHLLRASVTDEQTDHVTVTPVVINDKPNRYRNAASFDAFSPRNLREYQHKPYGLLSAEHFRPLSDSMSLSLY